MTAAVPFYMDHKPWKLSVAKNEKSLSLLLTVYIPETVPCMTTRRICEKRRSISLWHTIFGEIGNGVFTLKMHQIRSKCYAREILKTEVSL